MLFFNPSLKENFKIHINKISKSVFIIFAIFILIITLSISGLFYIKNKNLQTDIKTTQNQALNSDQELERLKLIYEDLKNQDQVKRNDELQLELENIKKTYSIAISVYEDLLEHKADHDDTSDLDALFAESLFLLTEENWQEAESKLNEITEKISPSPTPIPVNTTIENNQPTPNVETNNNPPNSGYSQQYVQTDNGNFLVKMVAADYGSTRVIVDTASSSDCTNNCPTLPLTEMVARNGAYAGIHGAYYCPADYPSCAEKVNSFDLLIMNKDKYYFNSDNNVYSNNPGVVFGGSYIRWLTSVSQWGRDTSIDSMLSNFPLLIHNRQLLYQGGDNIKSSRGFVANKENTVYIGVVHSASIADTARVLNALNMDNALNLDGGGTTALWHGGYKAGPGRGLTNAILFVNR